jgi:hypothetical protein
VGQLENIGEARARDERMSDIFEILEKDAEYNRLIKEFADDINVAYPVKYQKIFEISRVLFDRKRGAYEKIVKNTQYNDIEYWYSTINGEVQEKLTAVYHHYINIRNLEALTVGHSRKIIQRLKELKLDRSITPGFNFRKFGCEYEAFILQLQACFEHFIHSTAYYFNFKTTKPESFLKKMRELATTDQIAEKSLQRFEAALPSLVKVVISKSRAYPEGYSERDRIAHIGQIFLHPLNIVFNLSENITILPVGRYDGSTAFTNHPQLSESIEPLMLTLFDLIFDSYLIMFKG